MVRNEWCWAVTTDWLFSPRPRNDPLPTGVVATAQHRHLAQFVRCVTVSVATSAAWITGHADKRHAHVRCQADTHFQKLIGTRGVHDVLVEQHESPGTQYLRTYRVVVDRVFQYRAFELVSPRVNVVIKRQQVRSGDRL